MPTPKGSYTSWSPVWKKWNENLRAEANRYNRQMTHFVCFGVNHKIVVRNIGDHLYGWHKISFMHSYSFQAHPNTLAVYFYSLSTLLWNGSLIPAQNWPTSGCIKTVFVIIIQLKQQGMPYAPLPCSPSYTFQNNTRRGSKQGMRSNCVKGISTVLTRQIMTTLSPLFTF